jgi:ribosomal protein L11 methyltransferase
LWSQTRVIGLFEADTRVDDLLHHLKHTLNVDELPDCMIKQLANQNWERVWIDHFKPMQFGPKLWVCPTAYTPPDPDAINLILDPGLAFGTGTHATTAQCLEALPLLDINNKQVLDYGCGSGILAIAAARLGAATVWAIDIDEQALQATTENALRNKVDKQVIPELPDGLPDDARFDILLANILSGPLITLAPHFATRLNTNGTLILSGILAEQADAVCQAYKPWFHFEPPRQRDNWVCLLAQRLNNPSPDA